MQSPLELTAIIIIIAGTANLTFGSNALIGQVVNAQNMTENNNTTNNSTYESGTISSLPTPIRPPFVGNSHHYSQIEYSR